MSFFFVAQFLGVDRLARVRKGVLIRFKVVKHRGLLLHLLQGPTLRIECSLKSVFLENFGSKKIGSNAFITGPGCYMGHFAN